MKGVVPVNFLLMANTIKLSNPIGLKVYDLKGSRVGRNVDKSEGVSQTKKDMNLLNCKKNRVKGNLKGILQFRDGVGILNDIKNIRDILDKDSTFLKNNGYLDYSLLLAIETREDHLRDVSTNKTTEMPTYGAREDTILPEARESITDNILSNFETSKFA